MGCGYFFFVFGGQTMFSPHHGKASEEVARSMNSMIKFVAPLVLALLAALWWLLGKTGAPFALTPAEANFLVPAPLSRRRIVQYKLLSVQPALLTSAIFTTFVLRTPIAAWPLRLPAVLVLLTTMQLHQTGAALVRASLQENGRSSWRRVWPAVLVFGIMLAVILTTVARSLLLLKTATGFRATTAALSHMFEQPSIRVVLAPFIAVRAPLVLTGMAWVQAFAIAVVILVAHYFWVMNMDASFEEAAVEAGARHAAALEAMRSGKRVRLSKRERPPNKPWFVLPSAGAPAYAVWWKNVLHFTRSFRAFTVVLSMTIPLVMTAAVIGAGPLRKAFVVGGTTCFVFAAAWTLLGPMMIRNDLRMDLKCIELMRTLPVAGFHLGVAEISASAFAVAIIQAVFFLAGMAFMLAAGTMHSALIILALLIPGALLILAFNGILLVILNAFALLFPAWSKVGADRPGGVENMGQHMITMIGSVVLFAISLVPPSLGAAATAGVMYLQIGKYAVYPAAFVFIAAMYVEIVVAVALLGRAYDSIDPVDAGLCT